MAINHPKSGPNFVPAYQVSGIPFVTSSLASEVPGPDSNSVSLPVSITFPYVTKFITVRNTGINELRVGFSPDGVVAPGERLSSIDQDKISGREYFLIPSASIRNDISSGPPIQNIQTVQTFEVRCKKIFFLSNAIAASDPTAAAVSTSFSLLAGLTKL